MRLLTEFLINYRKWMFAFIGILNAVLTRRNYQLLIRGVQKNNLTYFFGKHT